MIDTQNLRLISVELRHLEAYLKGEDKLAAELELTIEEGWLVFPEVIEYSVNFLRENRDAGEWWMYFVIHRDDDRLIGNCGFKGAPNAEGMVEIGYAIAPAYEGRGYATEVAQGLTDRAFASPYVKMVDAHTLAEENASTSVLRKIGMKWVEEIIDPEDGKIWHWRITREEYEKGRLSPNLP